MKKAMRVFYAAACGYEIIKLWYLAAFAGLLDANMLFFKYNALASLCIPVLPWFMLVSGTHYTEQWVHSACLIKFLAVCTQLLYIFTVKFATLFVIANTMQLHGGLIKPIVFFLVTDMVLLFFTYIKGRMYYADNTDCERKRRSGEKSAFRKSCDSTGTSR